MKKILAEPVMVAFVCTYLIGGIIVAGLVYDKVHSHKDLVAKNTITQIKGFEKETIQTLQQMQISINEEIFRQRYQFVCSQYEIARNNNETWPEIKYYREELQKWGKRKNDMDAHIDNWVNK